MLRLRKEPRAKRGVLGAALPLTEEGPDPAQRHAVIPQRVSVAAPRETTCVLPSTVLALSSSEEDSEGRAPAHRLRALPANFTIMK